MRPIEFSWNMWRACVIVILTFSLLFILAKKHDLFEALKAASRLFLQKHAIRGMENVDENVPAVFICNHAGSYGPIAMELYFPYKFKPWVIHNITSLKLCSKYLEDNFIKRELKIEPPFSKVLSAAIAPFCILVMRAVEAIPVYRGGPNIAETFDISMDALMKGYNIVIFPENREAKFSKYVNDFHSGFVYLARRYYELTGRMLRFYPVYASRRKKTITIGKAIEYLPANEFKLERKHVAACLRDAINEIALAEDMI